MANALAAYHDRNKPSILSLAKEFDVGYQALRGRIGGAGPLKGRPPTNYALDSVQQDVLLHWITFMDSCGAPPTAASIQQCANDIIHESDPDRKPLWHGWGLAFTKRLPTLAPHLQFVKQKPKDPKRMEAEDVGLTEMWYDRLEMCIKKYGFRPKDIYNMDETGFRIGEGKAQKVVSASPISFTANGGHSESITGIECIAADGWKMPPWFLVKGQYHQESWYIDEMPDNWTIKPTQKGYSSHATALEWLDSFINATNHRVYRHRHAESDAEEEAEAEAYATGGRRRYGQADRTRRERDARREKDDRIHCRGYRLLLFDGHKSHCTPEFIIKCCENRVVPYAFRPHVSYICQPLDSVPFQRYKSLYRRRNVEVVQWGGSVARKVDFFREIVHVREVEDALSESIIIEGFRLCGIVPIDAQLAMEQEIRDANKETNDIWLDGFPDQAQERELASSITMSPPRDVLGTKSTSQKLLNDIAEARRRLAILEKANRPLKRKETIEERRHREERERRRLRSFLDVVERVLHRSTLICSTAGKILAII